MDRHQGHRKGPDHRNHRGTTNQPTLNNSHGTRINKTATTNRTTTRATTTMAGTEGTTITTTTKTRDTAETTTTTINYNRGGSNQTNNQQPANSQGRVYGLTENRPQDHEIVRGTILISNTLAKVLFDPGACILLYLYSLQSHYNSPLIW